MKINTFIFIMLLMPTLYSCGSFWNGNGNNDNNGDSPKGDDSVSANISDAEYLEKVDEYVNSIRENIEQTTIVKKETSEEKTVLFVKDNDTIKISVLDERQTSTDIYFKNSDPVFMTRHIILDVDSNYLETAYLKSGKIFKCFRDGIEIKDPGYLQQFEETLGDK